MLEMRRVFVIGNGGRESSIIWKLMRSKRVGKIYSTGNGGMYSVVQKVSIAPTDFPALASFAKENAIDLTIVAMDDLLAMDIVGYFQRQGLLIFGPSQAAARIEWSKMWAKELMDEYNIPTAHFEIFRSRDTAFNYAMAMIKKYGAVVIKADGLALGKGVEICRTQKELEDALDRIMIKKVHG